MLKSFKAYRVHAENDRTLARFDTVTINQIGTGGVVIHSLFSDINYKDALAVTGKGRIMKRFPLVAGIDVAGIVHSSDDPRFAPGDQVLVVGCGLGEATDGGYAEYVRVDANWVVPLPQGLTLRESMAIGTAGFTAGMAVERMEENGQTPAMGKVLVTGATGGVGGIAVSMLSGLGYEVTALTIADDSEDYLRQLGAAEVLDARKLDMGVRPLRTDFGQGRLMR
jgi:NADPH2:quinone reductase